MYWIYSITNKVNGKRYIGVTHRLNTRWNEHKRHLRNNCHVNKKLQDAYNEYGEDNFIYDVLFELEDTVDDCTVAKKEIEFISLYDSCDNGYNMTYGGDRYGFRIMPEGMLKEYKERLSNISKELWNNKDFRDKMYKLNLGNTYNLGKKASKETREKMSRAHMGSGNPFYGKHHTEESKDKMRKGLKDYYSNEDNMRKHKEAISKFIHTEEYRNKQSILSSGRSLKTTEYDALSIRYRYLCGEKPRLILKDYPKLTDSGLKKICYNITWKHLPNTKEELYNMLINYQTN